MRNVIKFQRPPLSLCQPHGRSSDAEPVGHGWLREYALGCVATSAHGPANTDLAKAVRQAARSRKAIVGNHDLEPTQALPWTSVSHLAEVGDGPRQAHTAVPLSHDHMEPRPP
jgi:hypothetical protein